MAYDKSKDELLHDFGRIGESMAAQVKRYDGGEPRLAVLKEVEGKKGTRLVQMFRIDLEFLPELSDFLEGSMVELMEQADLG